MLQPHPPSPSAGSLVRFSEDAEIRCWRDVLLAPPVRVRAGLGLRYAENRAGVALVTARVDYPFFNRVYLRTRGRGAAAEDVRALLAEHRSAGLRQFFVHVHPADEQCFAEELQRAELVRYPRSWVKLAGRLPHYPTSTESPSVAPGGALPAVETLRQRDAGAFAELFEVGFALPSDLRPVFESVIGTPGFHAIGARVHGVLAAVGLLYVAEQVAYLAGGVTLPDYRQRGLQNRLVAARVRLAEALGCHWIVSETGEEKPGQPQHSFRNMQRHGLAIVAVRHNYAPADCRW